MKPAPPVGGAKSPDALQPYAEALRERIPSREALLAEARALTHKRRVARNGTLAALLAVAISGALWGLDPAWRSEEVYVAIGQRQLLELADGSQVLLNSGSYLRIERRLRSRQLELVKGEGLFTVVHGDAPFIVRSQGVRVRDIGTVFDIRSDGRGVRVGVLQGAVEVSNAQGKQRLDAGQRLLASEQNLGATTLANLATLTAWQQGKLRFDGSPLGDVISDLQPYRQAPIRLADAATAQLRLSGEFDTASVEALLQRLPTILPLSAQRGADGSLTLGRTR